MNEQIDKDFFDQIIQVSILSILTRVASAMDTLCFKLKYTFTLQKL